MENEILNAYLAYCSTNNILLQQPSVIEVKRKYAYLYNVNGIIAKYVIKTGEMIA